MTEYNFSALYSIGCMSLWTLSLKNVEREGAVSDATPLITDVNLSEAKIIVYLKRFESHAPGYVKLI